jgi:hypothetical protein
MGNSVLFLGSLKELNEKFLVILFECCNRKLGNHELGSIAFFLLEFVEWLGKNVGLNTVG